MARDILAIPTSSVASESSFSHTRRLITDIRASLNSATVETLMCVKDWLPEVKLENLQLKVVLPLEIVKIISLTVDSLHKGRTAFFSCSCIINLLQVKLRCN